MTPLLSLATIVTAAALVVAPVANQTTLKVEPAPVQQELHVTDYNGTIVVSRERALQNVIMQDFDSLILNGYMTIQGN